jgi:ribosome-binding protein aMBF1 (putative translation factor)
MSGQRDRVARLAADLKVEKRELARAVLRLFPDGKLAVDENDTRLPRVPADFGATFGGIIRAARKERGWTQAQLAENVSAALGRTVPPLAVMRTEKALRPVPFDEVAALAAILDLSLDELIRARVQAGGVQ